MIAIKGKWMGRKPLETEKVTEKVLQIPHQNEDTEHIPMVFLRYHLWNILQQC